MFIVLYLETLYKRESFLFWEYDTNNIRIKPIRVPNEYLINRWTDMWVYWAMNNGDVIL